MTQRRIATEKTQLGKKLLAIVRASPGSTTIEIARLAENTPGMARRYLNRLAGEKRLVRTGNLNKLRWYPSPDITINVCPPNEN